MKRAGKWEFIAAESASMKWTEELIALAKQ